MRKTVTRTYDVFVCDKCDETLSVEKEFEEEFTCYACGKHFCETCRTNYENRQDGDEIITLCKECEQKIHNIFQKEVINDTTT